MLREATATAPLSGLGAVAHRIGDQFVVRPVRDFGAELACRSGLDMRDNCLCAGLAASSQEPMPVAHSIILLVRLVRSD
jgi:hypothetical protein